MAYLTPFVRLILLVSLTSLCSVSSLAQSAAAPAPRPSPETVDKEKNDTRMFATMEDEMRAKRQIQFEEKAYKDNLTRARDLATLATSIAGAFKEKKFLDRDDLKKLDKAEKLTKGIRDALGGLSDDVQLDERPRDLTAAINKFSDLTEALKGKVEKTPKRVVSAVIIDDANVLLEVIRLVRTMQPKN